MTMNPIAFAEEVNKQFFRYQLTAFPLSDPDLYLQARDMLGKGGEGSQLIKGPYISLSRSFEERSSLRELADEGRLHPAVAGIAEHPRMFAHQQAVFDAVKQGRHCLVSTGTGSGKTEAFLYPILDHCFRLRDTRAEPGIVAIIVYPMNALASDQLERLRSLLAGTRISFGMYIGSTPKDASGIENVERMREGEGRDRIPHYRERVSGHPDVVISPFEERLTEQEMVENPPRILLTNVNQLEYLLTRGKDLRMFENAPLRYLVFDEAHTYTGARGAEVALLIRRIRAFCKKSPDEVICIGSSATITDPVEGENAGKRFASRFFGIHEGSIELVREIYEEETWPRTRVKPRPVGSGAPGLFERTLRALGTGDEGQEDIMDGGSDPGEISEILSTLSSQIIDIREGSWKENLNSALKSNELVKVIYDVLDTPMHLSDATAKVWEHLGRQPPTREDEYEFLTYLTLGAVAEKDGSPILRPQLHYFIRGLAGAVGVLNDPDPDPDTAGHPAPDMIHSTAPDGGTPDASGPLNRITTRVELFFSAQKAGEKYPHIHPNAIFPVVSCRNCGQHFFEAWMSNLDEQVTGLQGGIAEGNNVYWDRTVDGEGAKILFTDRFVSEMDDGLEDYSEKLDEKRETASMCRECGTVHRYLSLSCLNPGCRVSLPPLPVHVLQQHGDPLLCPCCKYRGRRIGSSVFSPLRPLRAVTVGDIHILAQDMINAQRLDNRKLIVFADNRQDAAFQAAWMADHARRYRFRHLMYRIIRESGTPISVGDLVEQINAFLGENRDLARSLAPEVYAGSVEERYSSRIERDMLRYLRMTLLLELATSYSQRNSLESWGKARVVYYGLSAEHEEVRRIAAIYGVTPESLIAGAETLLDMYRKGRHIHDEKEPIFSRYWHPGCEEVQRGFIPFMDFPPKGLKLQRNPSERNTYTVGVISERGQTGAQDFVTRWGIGKDDVRPFLSDLWGLLTKTFRILEPVTLRGSRGQPLGGVSGVYQINTGAIGLVPQDERYRCSVCNRVHTRLTPNGVCSKFRCPGTVRRETPPEDDYDVSLLDREFTMLIAKEHTAQVPPKERQRIEKLFKDPKGPINCLVATPTLELGVDIGALDMVLLRNVPPLPSNYWQRAGRAGRRHRMAVIFTYCRKSIHDEQFFAEPLRILGGKIVPPRFNLRNPVMIEKHVHAAVITELVHRAQSERVRDISEEQRQRLRTVLGETFPLFISSYLFQEDRRFRDEPSTLDAFRDVVLEFTPDLQRHVDRIFSGHWPPDSMEEVKPEVLEEYITSMSERLRDHVRLIHQRMIWARRTRDLLMDRMRHVARLDEMERRLLLRCESYLGDLSTPTLDTYTLNVLARSGFLPGYTHHQGTINAFAGHAYTTSWASMSFELSRPDTLAVREFVPGNLLYANGGKYKVAWYHLGFGEHQTIGAQRMDPERYLIDTETLKIIGRDQPVDGYAEDTVQELTAIPIADAELAFISHVSDDEAHRFRMPIITSGLLREEHRGQDVYGSGDKEFSHVHGQGIRFFNIGPPHHLLHDEIGYPICLICGAVRSPYASEAELSNFQEKHGKSCGLEPKRLSLYADAKVDGFLFRDLPSLAEAVNLAEGIRTAASIHLEMNLEDLDILTLPKDAGAYDVLLFDPMPGGSGILDQILDQWETVRDSGIHALETCTGNCETSCYDCLKTYRNMAHHHLLDRHNAMDLLRGYTEKPRQVRSVSPTAQTPSATGGGASTNLAEMRLSALLRDNGFPNFQKQKTIPLIYSGIPSTRPDFYYEDLSNNIRIAIYLDGLSKDIHGSPEVRENDHMIRTILRSMGVDVIEIAATELDDPRMMSLHLNAIGIAMGRTKGSQ